MVEWIWSDLSVLCVWGCWRNAIGFLGFPWDQATPESVELLGRDSVGSREEIPELQGIIGK